jgi:hypothetical protein
VIHVSFPGVKRPGRGADHPLPSSVEVKERVELYLYSPSVTSWPVIGRTFTFSTFTFFFCTVQAVYIVKKTKNAAKSGAKFGILFL